MNILVLMAGGSDAFKEAGYLYPKNLAEIDGEPLAQHVIASLKGLLDGGGKLLCMVRQDENSQYHTGEVLQLLAPETTVLDVSEPTAGAACTALLAVEYLNNDEPLLIMNGDQIVTADLAALISDFQARKLDGGIVVFEAVHPRWSYVKCDADGLVVETAEKRPISKLATAGLYYFARGKDFVSSAMDMIRKDAHVGGLFYVCPAYNELILKQGKIGVGKIDRHAYFSLANPQGVEAYEKHLLTGAGRG